MSVNGITIAFGSGPFMAGTPDETRAWLKALKSHGITTIDTAQGYANSEAALGEANAPSQFTIDTKFSLGVGPTPTTKDLVVTSGQESLQKLRTAQVDVYYLHGPDRRVPWKETLAGIHELYTQGAFKRLGLSNFLAHEVDEVVAVARENSFIVPSVYQGNYNAVARRAEDEIFPTLRKHKIAFYAYSPIAGGFLSKSQDQLLHGSGEDRGRFGGGDFLAQLYNALYNRPSFLAALDEWERIAENEGVSRAELAYRWVVWHSKLDGKLGDAVIIGARNEQQLGETMAGFKKGPLSADAVERIEGIWESVKADAPLDNLEAVASILAEGKFTSIADEAPSE
ncbi:putative oxidoreductase [Podospora aff. communis PSN243]|uniref:Oxidoreductase n=1 Tax=Podospora aff. communis PSN243 TaxID=3040156 RepID=A0AAV9G416_9PEZI|nr:putative oxidoreductase [Podospora aff. communis PSN243]